MGTNLDKEKDSIDDYLTTATIALITGYFVLFSITKFNSNIASWTAIFSLLCFILTFNFWYKYRRAYKKEILETQIQNCIDNEIDVFVDYGELIKPIAENKFLEIYKKELTENTSGSITDLQKAVNNPLLDKQFDLEMRSLMDKNKGVLHALAENLFRKMETTQNNILKKPLNEKYRKVKFLMDNISFKSRYFLFCLGLIMFLMSIIINNLDLPKNQQIQVQKNSLNKK